MMVNTWSVTKGIQQKIEEETDFKLGSFMCWRTWARGWQMIDGIGKEKASEVCEVFQQN